ncbi:MAG: hypothetical protein ABI467_15710 [Kofleriaceae bacterium]
MRLRIGLTVGMLASITLSAHAEGDSLVDDLGPREIAVGEAMRAGATGSTAIGLNPAGLPLNQELVFEGGYGYRASDSASLVSASACDSTNVLPGCFYYDYAGSNPDLMGVSDHRATHIAGTTLAYPISPGLSFGSSAKYFHHTTNVMGEDDTSGFTFDVGANYRIANAISVGAAVYNAFGTESPEFPRAAGGGVLVRPVQMLALSFDARWKLIDGDHSARYGGGAELFMRNDSGQVGFPLRAGVLHDSGLGVTYLSAGLGLAGMKYGLDVAARHAVDGSDETMFIASLRFFGPRLQPGQNADSTF